MRRKDKEITDSSIIDEIIRKSDVCRLAMVDGRKPYLVLLSFGYEGNSLYFHSALKGLKIDILRSNPNVCFEFDVPGELITGESPCKWSVQYQSVIGFGKAEFLEKPDEKRDAFRVIMAHYSDQQFEFSDEKQQAVAMFKVSISELKGKQSGF